MGPPGIGQMDGKIPKGYLPWTGWDPQCPLYYPGPDAPPVDPVTWLPCDQSIVPAGYDCRLMASPWRTSGPLSGLGWVRTSRVKGKLRHMIGRSNYYGVPEGKLFVVSDDDGPPLASWYGLLGTCSYVFMTPHQEHFGLGIYRKDDSAEGFFMGHLGSPAPTASMKWTTGVTHHFDATIAGPLRMLAPSLWITPWGTTQESKVMAAGTTSFADTFPTDDWLVVPTGKASSGPRGTWLWHPQQGLHKLQDAPNDATVAWDDYGTDLVDAAWTYRAGKAPTATSYPVNDLYTSPFTTDAAQMLGTQRRLRSEPFEGYTGGGPWVVGCGYMAKSLGSTKLFRLSDGWGWEIPLTDTFSFNVQTITCDEIRGFGIHAPGNPETNTFTYYRIRLDSLGPPTIAPN